MALSLAIIVFLGIISHQLFHRMRLPGFLGVLFLGMLIGPYGLDWIDESILGVSADLRKIALIIILLRAGLGLHRRTLKMVGFSAVKMGVIPVLTEGFGIMVIAFYVLNFSWVEAGMLGFIIAAVSPAVIVPKMLYYIQTGKGAEKGIPTMILAGASLDDVIAITIFSSFAGYFTGTQVSISGQFIVIPLAVIIGVAAGLIIGFMLLLLFSRYRLRHTKKILIVLAAAIFLTSLEDVLQHIVPIASLLGVMVIGFILYDRKPELGAVISDKFNKMWVFAEILLFFLVGAEVNFLLAGEASLLGLGIIAAGLLARAAGVLLSLHGSEFDYKEKLFCIIAYSPKATVQAAIGSVPLVLGAPAGEMILILAVLSIVITAPLGAIAMHITGKRYLKGEAVESPV